ncbi:MAG: undecaprenyl-phosphate glucose phosphotransferase [Hyphomicrobiaceae bacterium]|nr:MAG: undecaprenyl-phosphate glucose phosphotransferase [Hyphomicrobiaceae bacterium]
MSRRGTAARARVSVVATPALSTPRAPAVRIPDRIVLDLLMVFEIGLVVSAAALAKLLYIATILVSAQDLQPYVLAGLAGGAITHYMLRTTGLHETLAIVEWRRHLLRLIGTIALSFLTLIAIAYLFKVSADYSRGWLLTWLMLVLILLPLGRMLSARVLAWLASAGYTVRRIAVVARSGAGQRIAESLRGVPGIDVVGVFEDAAAQGGPGAKKPKPDIAELISVGQRNEIDEVVVALSEVPQQRTRQLLDELSVLPIDVWLCPSEIDVPVLSMARLGQVNLLQVKPKPIREWGIFCKLALDYVAGALALVIFAPLMLLIALAVKLDSPGKVLFRQRRHGYNHRVIDVFKFRTMHVLENGDRIEQAKKDDPRVTRVGKFLRRTSLDELPQLFNVLRGEMSLVGPRPHAVAHNVLYSDRLHRYANRHCVKPGITGWAQIHGYRGPTDSPEKMRKRIEHDLYYIENWSLWLDVKILAATPFLGFVNRNAL